MYLLYKHEETPTRSQILKHSISHNSNPKEMCVYKLHSAYETQFGIRKCPQICTAYRKLNDYRQGMLVWFHALNEMRYLVAAFLS